MKSSPYFWHYVLLSKLRWRFRKILWPSQNIWTLKLVLRSWRLRFWSFGGYLPKTKRWKYEMNKTLMTCRMRMVVLFRQAKVQWIGRKSKKTNWIRNLKIQFITVTVLYLTNENFISPHIQKNVFLNYNYVTRELCLNRKNLTLWQICLSWAEHQGLTHF